MVVFGHNDIDRDSTVYHTTGTSHEINKIELVSDEDLKELMPWDKVEEHKMRALSPLHPM